MMTMMMTNNTITSLNISASHITNIPSIFEVILQLMHTINYLFTYLLTYLLTTTTITTTTLPVQELLAL